MPSELEPLPLQLTHKRFEKASSKFTMEKELYQNKTFEQINYVDKTVTTREFEACTFKKCNLSNSNFSYTNFIDCRFLDCNLSSQKLNSAGLRNVNFERCKLLGVNFNEANDFLFSVHFRECLLDYASFSNKKMLKTHFIDCSLKEVSFANANLSGSKFDNSNLERAIFSNTILKEVDFLTAYNYSLDPEINKIEKARFSLAGSVGLLAKYKISIE